jgi:uncharacterized surface protein with fasciclin (FAS1) repeats
MSVSCKKTANILQTSNNYQTILQYIAQAPQLTILNAAVARCHLDTVFSSGGPFTFFCPSDSAFEAAGLTMDKINTYSPDALSLLLQYNMLTGKFSSADLVGFLTEQVSSVDTACKPFIVKNYYGLFINGIQVNSEVELGDGVVLNIGSVNFVPTQTVLQILDSLPELSFFAAMANQVPQFQGVYGNPNGPAQPYHLGSEPGFTVFASTNTAFMAAGYPSLDSVRQTDPGTLSNAFAGITLNGFKFTPDFLGGFEINENNINTQGEFLQSGSFAIAKDGLTLLVGYPTSASGGPSQVPPHIIRANILATNGVIQEIDQVVP